MPICDYHHNIHNYHHNIHNYHYNIHNYHCNNVLVHDYHHDISKYHHSIVVAASNDTTHHNTLSLKTSARHDKGRDILATPEPSPQQWQAYKVYSLNSFIYIFYLLTTTTATNIQCGQQHNLSQHSITQNKCQT